MPADYYADAATPPAAAPEPKAPEAKEGDSDSQTAVLPINVFPEPPKVGDVCDFEVTQVNEDHAVVKYHTTQEEEPEEAPAPEQAPPMGGGGMGGGSSMYE